MITGDSGLKSYAGILIMAVIISYIQYSRIGAIYAELSTREQEIRENGRITRERFRLFLEAGASWSWERDTIGNVTLSIPQF